MSADGLEDSFLDWLDEVDGHLDAAPAGSAVPLEPLQATEVQDWHLMEQQMVQLLQKQIVDLATEINSSPYSSPLPSDASLRVDDRLRELTSPEVAAEQARLTALCTQSEQSIASERVAEKAARVEMMMRVHEETQRVRDNTASLYEEQAGTCALKQANVSTGDLLSSAQQSQSGQVVDGASALDRSMAALEQQNAALKAQLEEAAAVHAKAEAEHVQTVEQLEQQTTQLNAQMEQAEAEHVQTVQQLEQKQAQEAQAEHEKALAEAAEEARKQVEELEQQHDQLKQQVDELEQQIEELLKKQSIELEQAARTAETAAKANVELKQQNKNLTVANGSVGEQADRTQKQLQVTQKQNAELQILELKVELEAVKQKAQFACAEAGAVELYEQQVTAEARKQLRELELQVLELKMEKEVEAESVADTTRNQLDTLQQQAWRMATQMEATQCKMDQIAKLAECIGGLHCVVEDESKQLQELRVENKQLQELRVESKQLQELRVESKQLQELRVENKELQELRVENTELQELRVENKQLQELRVENKQLQELRVENKELQELRLKNKQRMQEQLEKSLKSALEQMQENELESLRNPEAALNNPLSAPLDSSKPAAEAHEAPVEEEATAAAAAEAADAEKVTAGLSVCTAAPTQALTVSIEAKNNQLFDLQQSMLQSPKSQRKAMKIEISALDLEIANLHSQLAESLVNPPMGSSAQAEGRSGVADEEAAAADEEEGVLDKATFLAAGSTEADFALLDVDGDGTVSQQEMEASQARAAGAAKEIKAKKAKAAYKASQAKKREVAAPPAAGAVAQPAEALVVTELTVAAAAGDTVLHVASSDGFHPGTRAVVGADDGLCENVVVDRLGSLHLRAPLVNGYSAGVIVKALPAAVTEDMPNQVEAKSGTPTIDELKQQVEQLKQQVEQLKIEQQQSAASEVKRQLEAEEQLEAAKAQHKKEAEAAHEAAQLATERADGLIKQMANSRAKREQALDKAMLNLVQTEGNADLQKQVVAAHAELTAANQAWDQMASIEKQNASLKKQLAETQVTLQVRGREIKHAEDRATRASEYLEAVQKQHSDLQEQIELQKSAHNHLEQEAMQGVRMLMCGPCCSCIADIQIAIVLQTICGGSSCSLCLHAICCEYLCEQSIRSILQLRNKIPSSPIRSR